MSDEFDVLSSFGGSYEVSSLNAELLQVRAIK